MKKCFSFVLSAMALLLASCTQEDLSRLPLGEEIQTQISMNLPVMERGTRVPHVDPAIEGMRVYLIVSHEGQIVKVDSLMNVNQNPINFDVRLVTGLEYDIAAWADYGDAYYTVAAADGKVSMKLGEGNAITGSDNKRDAYFGLNQGVVLTVNDGISMTLKRPFGLVKIVTQDYDEATVKALGLTSYSTSINMPTALNLLSGDADTPADVVITAPIADMATGELSYDYIFASAVKGLIAFTMDYKDADDATQVSYNFTDIPLQRNYKTNITGNVFTKLGNVTITIDQNWEGEYDHVLDGASLADALANATDGDVVTLANDIILSEPLSLAMEAGDTVVLDLNGKKLDVQQTSQEYDIAIEAGMLKIKGGDLETHKQNGKAASIYMAGTASLAMDSVDYVTNGIAFYLDEAATLEVTNSTVASGTFGVMTALEQDCENVHVTLKNSTFTGANPVLLTGNVEVDNCIITGTMHGMVMRCGVAIVKASTITLHMDDSATAGRVDYFKDKNWGNGYMVNYAALTIGNKNDNMYQLPTSVTLEDTELLLTGEFGSIFPALYAYANQGAGLGVTLTYDAACSFANDPVYGSNNITVNGSVVTPNEE